MSPLFIAIAVLVGLAWNHPGDGKVLLANGSYFGIGSGTREVSVRNPVPRGQCFQRKADSNPVIADSL